MNEELYHGYNRKANKYPDVTTTHVKAMFLKQRNLLTVFMWKKTTFFSLCRSTLKGETAKKEILWTVFLGKRKSSKIIILKETID